MAGETQMTTRRPWLGAFFGVAVGGLAGWVLGRAVEMAPAGQFNAPVAGLGVAFGLVVVGFVLAVLVVAGAVMFVSPQRRRMGVATMAAAAGWVAGYAVALWMF